MLRTKSQSLSGPSAFGLLGRKHELLEPLDYLLMQAALPLRSASTILLGLAARCLHFRARFSLFLRLSKF